WLKTRHELRTLSDVLASRGTEPPTSQMRCRRACSERNAWIGPLPSFSRAATLSVSFIPMMAKYSGRATMRAPVAAASSMRRPASCRFAATFGPEAIWIAATRNIDCVVDIVSRNASGVVVFVMITYAGSVVGDRSQLDARCALSPSRGGYGGLGRRGSARDRGI